jgi:iron complex transport system ATP-binding protein
MDLGGREDLVRRLHRLAVDPDAPTTVLVTHHVEEIPEGVTHAMLLRDGSIVRSGLVHDVIDSESLSETFREPIGVWRRRGRYFARAD